MAGVKGSQPSNLGSPIPNQERQLASQDMFMQMIEERRSAMNAQKQAPSEPQMQANNMDAQPESAPGSNIDFMQLLNERGSSGGEPSLLAPRRVDKMPPEAVSETGEGNFWQRARASFAESDTEVVDWLASNYGINNVRVDNDNNIYFRNEGEAKFRPFDRDDVDFVNDVIADNLRVYAEGVVDVGVGGLSSLVVGPVAGAAIGAMAGMYAADAIKSLIGINDDPERSEAANYALGTGISMAFPGGSALLNKTARGQAVKQTVSEFMSDTTNSVKNSKLMSEVGAKIAKFRESKLIPDRLVKRAARGDADAINNMTIELTSELDILQREGLAEIGTGQSLIPANTLAPDDPNVKLLTESIADLPGWRKYLLSVGNHLTTTFEGIAASAGKFGKDVEYSFVDLMKGVEKSEGAALGRFRQVAADKAELAAKYPAQGGKATARLTNFDNKLAELYESVGVQVKKDGLVEPGFVRGLNPQSIAANSGLSMEEARSLTAILKNYSGRLLKQKDMSPKQMEEFATQIQKDIDKFYNGKPAVSKQLIKLKNGLRDDWDEIISANLPEGEIENYLKQRAKYASVRQNMDKLGKLVKDNELADRALVRSIFKSEGNNLQRIKAVKAVLEGTDPEAWANIKGTYLNQFVGDMAGKYTTVVNGIKMIDGRAILSELDRIGEGATKEIFGNDVNKVKAVLKLADAFAQSIVSPKASTDKLQIGMLKKFYLLFANTLPGTKASAAGDLLVQFIKPMGGASKEQVLAKLTNREWFESTLEGMAENERRGFTKFIDHTLFKLYPPRATTRVKGLRLMNDELVTGEEEE